MSAPSASPSLVQVGPQVGLGEHGVEEEGSEVPPKLLPPRGRRRREEVGGRREWPVQQGSQNEAARTHCTTLHWERERRARPRSWQSSLAQNINFSSNLEFAFQSFIPSTFVTYCREAGLINWYVSIVAMNIVFPLFFPVLPVRFTPVRQFSLALKRPRSSRSS